MKKLIIAFAAVLVTAATSFAQGELNFNTRVPLANVDAPVFLPGGSQGPGPSYSAQLFLVGAGGALTPVADSLTTFRTAGTGAGAILDRYINKGAVAIPGSPGGTTVTLRIRGWQTSAGSYDAATIKGESANFQVALSSAPATPTDLPSTLQGFTMVPEPSTIALGVLGAAALLFRRRK